VHNQTLLEKRTAKLREAKGFRRMKLGLGAFRRGHKPKYQGKERVREINAGMVSSLQNEKPTNIKLVQPIPIDASRTASAWNAMDERDEKKKQKYEDIAHEIFEYLEDGKVSLSSLARHLKGQLGSDAEYRARIGAALGALASLLKLFPDTFTLLPSESGKANFYVQRKE
jgi:hypothetical protein